VTQIGRAIRWIRDHYAPTVRIEDLAEDASVGGLFHFKPSVQCRSWPEGGHGIQRGVYPAAAPMSGAAADEVRLGI
jgi:hypothetical protein